MRDYGVTSVAPWAAAPAVGPAGDLYFNTATKTLYESDGTSWLAVATGGPTQIRVMVVSPTFASGRATVTFSPAFTTLCDGATWCFCESVGAGSLTVGGIGSRTRTTVDLLCSNATFNGALQVALWAWGH